MNEAPGASLETGVPHALFPSKAIFNGEVNLSAPAPDGQKFYFAEPSPESKTPQPGLRLRYIETRGHSGQADAFSSQVKSLHTQRLNRID